MFFVIKINYILYMRIYFLNIKRRRFIKASQIKFLILFLLNFCKKYFFIFKQNIKIVTVNLFVFVIYSTSFYYFFFFFFFFINDFKH